MTAEQDADVQSELDRQHARWMADPRVRVEAAPSVTRPRRLYYDVFCSACGIRLAFAPDEQTGRGLAIVNATARPCCEAWQ